MPPIDIASLLTVLTDLGGPLMGLPARAVTAPDPEAAVPGTLLNDLVPLAAPAGERGPAWAAAVFFALLTLALTVWLHRRIKPELLTPANAHLAYTDEATQPGGTPSA